MRIYAEPNLCGLCISDADFMGIQPNNNAVMNAHHVLKEEDWLVISDENLARGTDFRTLSPNHKMLLFINKSAKHRRDFTQFVGRAKRHGDQGEIWKLLSLKELDPRVHPTYQTQLMSDVLRFRIKLTAGKGKWVGETNASQ